MQLIGNPEYPIIIKSLDNFYNSNLLRRKYSERFDKFYYSDLATNSSFNSVIKQIGGNYDDLNV